LRENRALGKTTVWVEERDFLPAHAKENGRLSKAGHQREEGRRAFCSYIVRGLSKGVHQREGCRGERRGAKKFKPREGEGGRVIVELPL